MHGGTGKVAMGRWEFDAARRRRRRPHGEKQNAYRGGNAVAYPRFANGKTNSAGFSTHGKHTLRSTAIKPFHFRFLFAPCPRPPNAW